MAETKLKNQAIKSPVWVAPTLLNSWRNEVSGEYTPVGYYKDTENIVHLRGLITSGTNFGFTTNCYIFLLPVGYRPVKANMFQVISNGAIGRVDVMADGNIRAVAGSNIYVSLDGITFLAEQ